MLSFQAAQTVGFVGGALTAEASSDAGSHEDQGMGPSKDTEVSLQLFNMMLPAGRAWICTSSAMTGRL